MELLKFFLKVLGENDAVHLRAQFLRNNPLPLPDSRFHFSCLFRIPALRPHRIRPPVVQSRISSAEMRRRSPEQLGFIFVDANADAGRHKNHLF